MIHHLVGDTDAENRHADVLVGKRFEHCSAKAARQGSLLHGHHPADPAGEGMDQALIQWAQETGIDHRCRQPRFLQKRCRGQGRMHHGPVGNDHQVVPFTKQLAATHRDRFPAFLHQRHAHAGSAGNPQCRRTVVVEAGHQHLLQLRLIFGRHHREIRNGSHIADVVLTLMGRPIGTNDAGPIEHEGDGQLLNAHVMDQLVVGPLQKVL